MKINGFKKKCKFFIENKKNKNHSTAHENDDIHIGMFGRCNDDFLSRISRCNTSVTQTARERETERKKITSNAILLHVT